MSKHHGTIFSKCYRYRYTLYRELPGVRGRLVFICLNPSTATAKLNDPTVRRCIGYGTSWNFSELYVLNLFAFRATDPREMLAVRDPVGPDNDLWFRRVLAHADMVVCAWGTKGGHLGRDLEVNELLLDFGGSYCLDETKYRHPRHPLYARADLTPVSYYGNLLWPTDNAGDRLDEVKTARRRGKRRPGATGAADGPA